MPNEDRTPDTDSSSEQPTNWALTKRLLALAWQYRRGCLKVLCLQLVILALGLSGLGLMGVGVDFIKFQVVSGAAPIIPKPPRWPLGLAPPAAWAPLVTVGVIAGAMLLLALVRALLNYAYSMAVAHLVHDQIVAGLRSRVYDKLQRLSFRFFDSNASGSLINRVTGDVQAVRMFIDMVVVQSIILVLSLAVYFIYMVRIHALLTVACLATTPLLWMLTIWFARRTRPAFLENRKLTDRLVLNLSENIRGAHVVKGFARQEDAIAHFTRASEAVRKQKHWVFRQLSRFNPAIGFLTQVNLFVLLAYGGILAIAYERAPDLASAAAAGLSLGELLVFSGLLQQFSGQIQNVSVIANTMQQSLTSAQRVFEVLDTPVEIDSPEHPAALPSHSLDITFREVSFGYDKDDLVLDRVSLHVNPGESIALLGATGAGKSALLSLITRFYDSREGAVLVGGQDVRDVELDQLRRSVGLVFQESFLFSSTVAANIAFGNPDATREQIEQAARIARAHDFIMELPQGYDSIIRENGSDLSGGQRQRLAIARALLLDPPILILDDPTAAIDPQTEEEILQAMDQAMAGRTTFIVAHRMSTLRRADRVAVLEHGRITELGRHAELLENDGFYATIAALQSGQWREVS